MKQGINQDLTDKIFEKTIDDGSTFSDTYTNLCGLEINYNYIPNYCCDGIHSYGQTCNHDGTNCAPPPHTVVIQVVFVLCPEESVGGPTSPSNPTNPTDPPTGSGGGTISDGSNPDDGVITPINNEAEQEIITIPLLPGLTSDVQEIDDPCAKLKVLLSDSGLNLGAEINYLKDKINDSNNDREHAVSVTRRTNIDGNTEYRLGPRIALGANGGSLPTGGYVVGGLHCHTPFGYSMFSLEDVYSLKNLYNA